MTTIFCDEALLPGGWTTDVRLTISAGRIAAIETNASPHPGDERCAVLLPTVGNLHSHAFQRAMAGMAERRTPMTGSPARNASGRGENGDRENRSGADVQVREHRKRSDRHLQPAMADFQPGFDTFWTWREVMYRHALSMTPDHVEAVAAMLYVEMLEAGFGRVGEFHYLHHDRDGSPYADRAEMASRIAAAAEATGIRLTLLPVLYAHATFGGAAPTPGQRRFINDPDGFAGLLESSREAVRSLPEAVVGVAPHSLRAVTPEELAAVIPLAADGPVHMHIAEQVKEVDDCVAWSGARPVEWLLANAEVDARWCLIHATHMSADETRRLAATGAVAGLCPVTEANLGDGIFQGPLFAESGGRFGVGSDSNVLIGLADELRQFEYAQRLGTRTRNVMAAGGGSTGRALFEAAHAGAAQALGASAAGIAVGAPADLFALDRTHPTLEGKSGDAVLDAFVFAAAGRPDCVWIGGTKVVDAGRHVARDAVERKFRAALRDLAEA